VKARRLIIELVLQVFVLVFWIGELCKVLELGIRGHFSKSGAWIDLMSLSLCTIVFVNSYIISSGESYSEGFDIERLTNPETRAAYFEKMLELGMRWEEQSTFVGVNLLLVFVRAVMLVGQLQDNFGLILNVLGLAFWNMFTSCSCSCSSCSALCFSLSSHSARLTAR